MLGAIRMNNRYEVINIVISILGFAGLLVELGLIVRDQKRHVNEVKIQEAINLSEKIKNLISRDLNFILTVLDADENYKNIVKHLQEDEIKVFNKEEFDDICKKNSELEKYFCLCDYFIKENMSKLSEAYLLYCNVDVNEYAKINSFIHLNWKMSKEEMELIKEGNNSKEANLMSKKYVEMNYYKSKISKKFSGCVNETLNELEELCMSLNKGIVDEDTVYQSLHQIVIRTVKYLYPVICYCNRDNNTYDKYYTHTITLYNDWVAKRNRYKEAHFKNMEVKHKKIYN